MDEKPSEINQPVVENSAQPTEANLQPEQDNSTVYITPINPYQPSTRSKTDAQETNILPITNINSISFTDQFCAAFLRLPQVLTKQGLEKSENLSYREIHLILASFGIKWVKTRSKPEMLNAIAMRAGNIWSEIYTRCQQTLKHNEQVKKEQKQKAKQNLQFQSIPRVNRTPFDPRLAEILADLYMSPTGNWNDFLVTSTPEESRELMEAIKSIRPEGAEPSNSTFPIDSFLLQYIAGQSRITDSSLSKFLTSAEDLNNMINSLKKNETCLPVQIQPDQTQMVTRSRVKN